MMNCGFNTTYWDRSLQRVVKYRGVELPVVKHSKENYDYYLEEVVGNECYVLQLLCEEDWDGNYRVTHENFGYHIPNTDKILMGKVCICEEKKD